MENYTDRLIHSARVSKPCLIVATCPENGCNSTCHVHYEGGNKPRVEVEFPCVWHDENPGKKKPLIWRITGA